MLSRLRDWLHERRIDAARMRVTRYPTMANNTEFKRLLMMRSPSQIQRMERRMGI